MSGSHNGRKRKTNKPLLCKSSKDVERKSKPLSRVIGIIGNDVEIQSKPLSHIRGNDVEIKSRPFSCMRGNDVEIKSFFGRYSNIEMLVQLKGLALNPCNLELSRERIQPLWNQAITVRKLMALTLSDTTISRRKRKLKQFCKDKLRTASALDESAQKKGKGNGRGQLSYASSLSCVLNPAESAESFEQKITLESCNSASLVTFEDSFGDKQICMYSFLEDAIGRRTSTKYPVPLVDSDESVNGSTPLTPENLNHQDAPSPDGFDAIQTKNYSNLHKPRRSVRILSFIGDHLERKVVPVGPRFQANVPQWTGPIDKKNYGTGDDGSEDSRWLGTKMWPVEGESLRTGSRAVGKGRPDHCSCVSPGSIDCIKRHILEERLLLQCALGPAFFGWKFDEMGEQAAKSWTVKEQGIFEAVVKSNSVSKRKNFMKHALKSFPLKSRKNVFSYYFNVFIPRHIGQQTRLSLEQVDSDVDEADNFNYLNYGRRQEGKADVPSLKVVKTLYLRRPS